MPFRLILALAATAALALPAAALAEGPGAAPPCAAGQVPSATAPCRLPLCVAGQVPSPTAPCGFRICNAGQASTPDAPCLSPCAPGVRPTADAPCVPVPGSQPTGDGPQKPGPGDGSKHAPQTGDGPGDGAGAGDQQPGGDAPKGAGFGFVKNRVWRVTAEADGYDADRHALSVVVDNVAGIAPKLASRLENALGDQADVLVGAKTRVLDADGHRLTGDAAAKALDAANTVTVTGKIAPPKAWAKDEDGSLVPAIRALRVKITS
jgi:hypothetical protein